MGEHHTNRTAVIRAMLPAFPVGSDYTNVQLRAGFALRRGLIIVPPEKIRTTEAGVSEVLVQHGDGEEWAEAPKDATVVPEGQRLGYEHLDYVVNIFGSEVRRTVVVGKQGNEHPMTLVQLGEILRMPAPDFLRHFKPGNQVNGDAGLLVTG